MQASIFKGNSSRRNNVLGTRSLANGIKSEMGTHDDALQMARD